MSQAFAIPMLLGAVWAQAQEPAPKLIVRDVNVFVMSSYGSAVNHRDLFRSTLPSFASPKRTTAERKKFNEPSPAGLITFEGQPAKDIDVLLEFDNGRFFANWPPANQRSKRLLWAHASLSVAGAPPALPEGHWLQPFRESDRLFIEAAHRSDRFILYDAELPLAPPLKITSVEGGYGLINLSKYPLLDVTVYRPEKDRWGVAKLEKLESTAAPEVKKEEAKPNPEAVFEDSPAGAGTPASADKPQETPATPEAAPAATVTATTVAGAVVAAAVVVDSPAAAGAVPAPAADGSPAPPMNPPVKEKTIEVKTAPEPITRDQMKQAWHDRLIEIGMGETEARYATTILVEQALRSDSATLVCRLGEEQLDTMLPLEVTPSPDKQIRVAFLVLLDADPDLMNRVEELVKNLGAADYSEREAAEKRLRELGPAARPKLQEAVNNSDPEISFRASEIVESFDLPQPAAGLEE